MTELLNTWRAALAEIQQRKSFALLTHVRPDGDAYGSILAFGLALEALGKEVLFLNEDGQLDKFHFLPAYKKVQKTPVERPAVDAIISLDNAAYKRLGPTFCGWNAEVLINIDHHISNEKFGTYNLIDGASPATGQLLFELFEAAGWPITADISDLLYVAIATDTGSFKYRSTTARTFEVAAAIASTPGARTMEMARHCFSSFPLRRTKLLKEILIGLEFDCNDRLAYYSITQEMYARTGALPEDTEGLVETIITTEEVELALVMEERTDGTVKMSFRSKGEVNVSALAAQFGGGGHKEAAGAQLPGTLAEVAAIILPAARAALQK